MKKYLIIAVLLNNFAAAQTKPDQKAYCSFVTEQGRAEALLLRAPSATGGVTRPSTGTTPQLYAGIRGSISDLRKAGLTLEAARQNCNLYKSTVEAMQSIQYADESLEKEALQFRVVLLEDAIRQLDTLIAQKLRQVDAGNATKLSLYSLQNTRTHLFSEKALAQRSLATKLTLNLSSASITALVAEKQNSEVANQKAITELAKQNSWNFQWEIGAHKTINDPTVVAAGITPSSMYGDVSLSYNFGSHKANKHLDAAAASYAEWKKTQEMDVAQSAETLRKTVANGIGAEDERLTELISEEQMLHANLELLKDISTNAGMMFADQLTADELVLRVEVKDAQFRKERLQNYLQYNFPEPGAAVAEKKGKAR